MCGPVSGCAFLDDFSKFKAKQPAADAGNGDAGGGSAMADGSTADAGADAAPADPCASVKCTKLDGPCTKGVCKAGKCSAVPINEGNSCAAGKCTDSPVCTAGECKGTAKDCTAMDTDCQKGVCDAQTGSCGSTNINEGGSCSDGDACTTSDSCTAGACAGTTVDCSKFTDTCLVGACDPGTGDCVANVAPDHTTCDDRQVCTTASECSSGNCVGTVNAPLTTACNDYNDCTGTTQKPDHCDGSGNCTSGDNVTAGTACDDNNDCTGPAASDKCDGAGKCSGASVANGTACQTQCRTAATCVAGECHDAKGKSSFNPQCTFNWCGNEKLCDVTYKNDGTCDCGCNALFDDSADCNPCSAQMCTSKDAVDPDHPSRTTAHVGAQQCDSSTGAARTDCPVSYKTNGQCDCGCQFVDPECSGGNCCMDGTGSAGAPDRVGCADVFVQECVCSSFPYHDPFCCDRDPNTGGGHWDATCAAEATALGCAVCP
ncbi:MAG TPA: hypothetical protein VF331_00735 [Polyangiales bacterium]